MTMTDTERDRDMALEAFFDAGRKAAPQPSAELLARITADADATLAATVPARPARRRGIAAWLGGWPVLAGLATAAAAGVWIGYSTPTLGTVDFGTSVDTYDLGGLLPGYGASDAWSG
jgi:hypothetical protein